MRSLAVAIVIALAVHTVVEGVDVRVEHDKTFDFRPVRTWGWNAEGPAT